MKNFEKSENDRLMCFTIMPFNTKLNSVYTDVIVNILNELEITSIRADEFFNADKVVEGIDILIKDADLIIADITDNNPNVFYEIGKADAHDRDAGNVRVSFKRFTLVPGGVRSRRSRKGIGRSSVGGLSRASRISGISIGVGSIIVGANSDFIDSLSREAGCPSAKAVISTARNRTCS